MEIRQYLTEPSFDLQKISRKSTQTQIHIHTHTQTYRELPSLPISWFWSWRPLFILMPMARNPIHGSRSLRRLHVSAAGTASAAASAGVACCCCWRVENQLYVDSAAAVVGNAHLPSAQCVCVGVRVVCMRVCMCAQKKKKSNWRKAFANFLLTTVFFYPCHRRSCCFCCWYSCCRRVSLWYDWPIIITNK